MSLGLWNVVCTDPDKCTVVIKYIILQSDVPCELLLAANKSFCATCCCFPHYEPIKTNSFFPYTHERITDKFMKKCKYTHTHTHIPNTI